MRVGKAIVALGLVSLGHAIPRLLLAQSIDTAQALTALREAAKACVGDNGSLWQRSLCGPIALVDRQTRLVIANDTVGGRPYIVLNDARITTAPANVGFANTSFDWNGRSWAMILLPLPVDRFDRVTLLMHEVFHREQGALHLGASDPPNNQLDQLQGRYWFRLELHALASALDALGSGNVQRAREHAQNALLFRARRYALYPGADSLERQLEMQEGLAEYTGERLAMNLTGEDARRVAKHLREFESNPTYVRSFAYATGPALGVLLDQFAPSWRREIASNPDPARLLRAALNAAQPRNLASAADRAAHDYGARELMVAEQARDSALRPTMVGYRERLVDGPTLTLRQKNLSRSFNPQTLVGFDMTSTVYPTGSFNADWGSLTVKSGGALVANNYSWLRIGAPASGVVPPDRILHGEGWELKLADGWQLQPVTGRLGSYEVQRGDSLITH